MAEPDLIDLDEASPLRVTAQDIEQSAFPAYENSDIPSDCASEFPNFHEFFEDSEFSKLFSTSPSRSTSPALPLVGGRSRSSVSSIETVIYDPLPVESPTPAPRRGRAQSNSFRGEVNPSGVRFISAEQQLANLIAGIKLGDDSEQRGRSARSVHFQEPLPSRRDCTPTRSSTIRARDSGSASTRPEGHLDRAQEYTERVRRKADLTIPGGYRGTELTRLTNGDLTRKASVRTSTPTPPPQRALPVSPLRRCAAPPPLRLDTFQPLSPPLLRPNSFQPPPSTPRVSSPPATVEMNNNFQYIDSPQGAPGSNPRQAPPSPSQSLAHSNGMNGAVGFGGNMVGFPTPAGHQSDLNFVMSKIEELSRTLEHNRRLTDDIVTKVGLVRERAKDKNLTNDELVALVTSKIDDSGSNMEKELSELRKALEHANYEKDENFKLCQHACHVLNDVLEKMHDFKAKNESDYLAWHKSYRNQLAAEREENLELRCRISDMQAHAANANEWIRKARRWHDDHDEFHELRVQNHYHRLRGRFYRRLALQHLPDDDPEWSDDDDLIDPEEKKRLESAKKERSERIERDGVGPSGSS